jgi:WD40 repeat protein
LGPNSTDQESLWFVAGNNLGQLGLWNFGKYFSNNYFHRSTSEKSSPDIFIQTPTSEAIYALVYSKEIILSGGENGIMAWSTKDMSPNSRPLFHVDSSPLSGKHKVWTNMQRKYETNGLMIDPQNDLHFYSACGDNCAYAWDLSTHQMIGKFVGHTDYVHCVIAGSDGEIVTGAEDGTVRFWDTRSFKQTRMLQVPTKVTGENWVSAVVLDSEKHFLACGGGNHFINLWHLPSNSIASCLPVAGHTQALVFNEEELISAGNTKTLYFWKKNGTLIRHTKASPKSIFSCSLHYPPQRKMLAVAGTGQTIDIMMGNLGNKSFSLHFSSSLEQ